MGAKTTIAWTDSTWNPTRGCRRVSPGCLNCYAERVAARHSTPGQPFEGLAHFVGGEARWTGDVLLVRKHLHDPLAWRKPRRVFVDSVSDLFYEPIPDEYIDEVFGVMAACYVTGREHIFQVLTKREERMHAWFQSGAAERVREAWAKLSGHRPTGGWEVPWPLPNVQMGVSCEDQEQVDRRVPFLLRTPAAVRWVSIEPQIGPVTLRQLRNDGFGEGQRFLDVLARRTWDEDGDYYDTCPISEGLDWAVVGGESGPNARLFNCEWARSLRDEFAAAGVPIFIKQMGSKPHDADGQMLLLVNTKGEDPNEWPDDLRVRQYPETAASRGQEDN